MFNIIIIDKVTKKEQIIDAVKTEEQAESFCDAWGWNYCDERGKSYYIDYMEVWKYD